jgi:hypothetical protein
MSTAKAASLMLSGFSSMNTHRLTGAGLMMSVDWEKMFQGGLSVQPCSFFGFRQIA